MAPLPFRTLCRLAVIAGAFAAGPAAGQLDLAGQHRVSQSGAGGTIEAGDRFGTALAAADFNCDGYDDLAIGAPDEDVGAVSNAGSVYVVWGSAPGLALGALPPQALDAVVLGRPAIQDRRFGTALAAGDFDANGCADLAIGSPFDDNSATDTGAVYLLRGFPSGLSTAATYLANAFQPGANYGHALATCKLNSDGFDDLVIGAPSLEPDTTRPGEVLRLFGAGGNMIPGPTWVPADGEGGDRFGYALACGDLDGDGLAEIVASAPEDSSGARVRTFASIGSTTVSHPILGDAFRWGDALAVADLRGVGLSRLVIGVPADNDAPVSQPGKALVGALADAISSFTTLRQGLFGLADQREPLDHFASALAVGDFDRDGRDDLVVGVPDEDLFDSTEVVLNAGMVQVNYGTAGHASGLSNVGQTFHWGTAFLFAPLPQDHFGTALAVGDFDRDGIDDLAIGVPGALWSGQAATGLIQVLYGSKPDWLFGDGFETGTTAKWSTAVD